MQKKTCIVSVVYREPEWVLTKVDIEASPAPVLYVDRKPAGVGSLAEAINSGFRSAMELDTWDYIWFVTNVRFKSDLLQQLVEAMEVTGHAAIHPAFNSDHKHMQLQKFPGCQSIVLPVPFVEFTAPIVRASVFKDFPLDERLPYVGHDTAWGYDVRQAGHTLGVFHGGVVAHTYIRHSKRHPITMKRRQLRQQSLKPTIKRLKEKYGEDFAKKMEYFDKW